MRTFEWLGAVAVAAMLVGCGAGAAQERAPTAAPASPAADAQGTGGDAATPAQSAAPPPPPSAFPAPEAQRSREEAPGSMGAQVSADIKRAEQDVAAGDCPTACRALDSMERAVVFLCASNQSGDDADRCDNAKHHLTSARRRIRANCGACPGGPSVDPDAPIPSKR